MQKIRCAIYTRKSSEDGLEQAFNSLDAQREACAAYIASQKAEGWVLLADAYDDGGISGGTLERPAMQRLLDDVDAGRVDQIVLYKIDRLTRSLADFAKIVDRQDKAGASFVSVTQSFNTATSMGRLTLNMLLSFAQFEREVTAERIRDKIAASKKKGLWMGGTIPIGYQAEGRTLVIDETDAGTILTFYDLYLEHGTVRAVAERAEEMGLRSRRREGPEGRITGGGVFSRGHIQQLLTNPVYAGRIRHKKEVHEGQHEPLIAPDVWEDVQRRLIEGAARTRGVASSGFRSPLIGKVFDETGDGLRPSHSRKNGKRLRYYISRRLVTDGAGKHPDAWRLPAPQLEQSILRAIRGHLQRSTVMAEMLPQMEANEAGRLGAAITTIAATLSGSAAAANLRGLVAKVNIAPGRIAISLDPTTISERLGVTPDRIAEDALSFEAPFTMRRRGVETKIILGTAPRAIDKTLIRNIVKAQTWFDAIKSGKTYVEIAAHEGVWKQRVQQMIGLAFLAPDIVAAIAEGRQPTGLTTEWLRRNPLPASWEAQRVLIAAL